MRTTLVVVDFFGDMMEFVVVMNSLEVGVDVHHLLFITKEYKNKAIQVIKPYASLFN
jgi:ATP adenylyltransferase/5',5'''-P-1,P-4-tetraphosphate phosphorylase II